MQKPPVASPPAQERVHPGHIIKRVRQERHMTMRELARRIDVTPGHLSKIERGLANPSVGTLWTISDELGLPVSALFSADEGLPSVQRTTSRTTPSVAEPSLGSVRVFAPVVDPSNRESIKMAGVEFQRLTPHDDLAIEFMEVRHEVGAGDEEAYRHRGHEYGLVLQGQLRVEIGFATYMLEPGWSVAFDSDIPHRVLNAGDQPAVAVWAVIGRNQA